MEFSFYLDAWRYCYQHNLSTSSIVRTDWKTWTVELSEKQNA